MPDQKTALYSSTRDDSDGTLIIQSPHLPQLFLGTS